MGVLFCARFKVGVPPLQLTPVVHHLLKKNQRIKRKGKKEGGVKGSITNHGSILGSAENIKWTNQMAPSMEKNMKKKKA